MEKRRPQQADNSQPRGRVLARLLAEELQKVHAGETTAATTSVTYVGGSGRPDITNVQWDADTPEV